MEIERAREIIKQLADGVDPTTGEVLPRESVYNKPEVIRALFTILQETSNPIRNAGKPWTDIEDDKLADEFASKISISEIAAEHGRTRGAIESRLEKLGLKKKPFWFWKWNRE